MQIYHGSIGTFANKNVNNWDLFHTLPEFIDFRYTFWEVHLSGKASSYFLWPLHSASELRLSECQSRCALWDITLPQLWGVPLSLSSRHKFGHVSYSLRS